jgi:hypothetical protein
LVWFGDVLIIRSELQYMQTESAVTINLLQSEREKERTLAQRLEAAQV